MVAAKYSDSLRGYAHAVLIRDNFTCRYCGLDGRSWPNWLYLSWDHLLPHGHPRRDDVEFIVAACRFCNECHNRSKWIGETAEAIVEEKRLAIAARRAEYQRFWDEQVQPRDADATMLANIKRVAAEYRARYGRPLGVTGEVAEIEAARLLDLELCAARQAGFDAVGRGSRAQVRYQIKGRCVQTPLKPGTRAPSIRMTREWDVVLLVLLNPKLEPIVIYEAERAAIEGALTKPGSKSRNERGSLAVSQFRGCGRQVWPPAAAAGTEYADA